MVVSPPVSAFLSASALRLRYLFSSLEKGKTINDDMNVCMHIYMSDKKFSYELEEIFSSRFNESSNMDATIPFLTLVSSDRYPERNRWIYQDIHI